MEGVVVSDCCPYPAVDSSWHGFPDDLDKAYPPVAPPHPFSMIMTVFHVQLVGRVPSPNVFWTRSTVPYQLTVSGPGSRVTTESQPWSCPVHICDGPPDLWCQRCRTSHLIPPPWGTESSMINGYILTGILSSRGGMCGCIITTSTVILAIETRSGGDGRLVGALSHPHIRCRDSFTRGGSDARMNSTSTPESTACLYIYLCRRTLIK